MELFVCSWAVGAVIGTALCCMTNGPLASFTVGSWPIYRTALICFDLAGVFFAIGGSTRLSGAVLGGAFVLSLNAMRVLHNPRKTRRES